MHINNEHRSHALRQFTPGASGGSTRTKLVHAELMDQGLRKSQANDVCRAARKKAGVYKKNSGRHNPNPLTHPPEVEEKGIVASAVDLVAKVVTKVKNVIKGGE